MNHQFEQLRVRLVTDEEDGSLRSLERDFPTVTIERGNGTIGVVVDDYVWRGAFDLGSLDDKIERAGPQCSITVRGRDAVQIAAEVLSRYQRFVRRRNDASSSAAFESVLRWHAGLFDVSSELGRSELAHALDTWQWTLRLHPEVGLAVQLAALFHDVPRLLDGDARDTRERLEHRALVPPGTKDVRPGKGADRVLAALTDAGIPVDVAEHVQAILNGDARLASEGDFLLLNDADALSFLSLGSSAYVDYFGVAQTRRKVAYTLARLGPHAKKKLDTIRLRPDVERLLHEVAA